MILSDFHECVRELVNVEQSINFHKQLMNDCKPDHRYFRIFQSLCGFDDKKSFSPECVALVAAIAKKLTGKIIHARTGELVKSIAATEGEQSALRIMLSTFKPKS